MAQTAYVKSLMIYNAVNISAQNAAEHISLVQVGVKAWGKDVGKKGDRVNTQRNEIIS